MLVLSVHDSADVHIVESPTPGPILSGLMQIQSSVVTAASRPPNLVSRLVASQTRHDEELNSDDGSIGVVELSKGVRVVNTLTQSPNRILKNSVTRRVCHS